MRVHLTLPTLLGAMALLVAATAVAAGERPAAASVSDSAEAEPVTTIVGEAVSPKEDADLTAEYQMLADERGFSVDQARAMMAVQNRLGSVVDSVIGRSGIIDFRYSDDGLGGTLLVERHTNVRAVAPEISAHPEIRVQEMLLTKEQRLAAEIEITSALLDTTVADANGRPLFRYNGFESTYHLVSLPDSGVDLAALSAQVTDALARSTGEPGLTVLVEKPSSLQPAFGGRNVLNGSLASVCTTGFGIKIAAGSTGYVTAGHCGTTASILYANSNLRQANLGRRIGFFNDRMAIRAGGASWNVQIDQQANLADMSSVAGNVYTNGFYCHYGRASNAQRCGTAYVFQSYLHTSGTGDGVTDPVMWVSVTTADCTPGDSGGPVWAPGAPRLPKGMINANFPGGDCGYVGLLDQMSDTTWTLL